MNDALQVEQQEAAVMPLPKLRMDRSRTFQTIHGERGPADRYSGVQFIQDGLMFDAQGFCVIDHPDHEKKGPEGDKLRKALERKIKKARTQQAKEPPPRRTPPAGLSFDGDDEDDEDRVDANEDDDEDDDLEPINLEAWLRGEQEVEWQEVTQEIARRFKKRVAKMEDAVAFLCTEIPFPKAQLRKKFQKYAD